PPAGSGKYTCTQEDKRRVEEEGVDPVEKAAVAGEEASAVLGSKGALEHRFGQVADRPEEGRTGADQRCSPDRQLWDPDEGHRDCPQDASESAADRSLPGLAGRDALVELPPAERAPDEVGERVVEPGDGDGEDDPPLPARKLPQGNERGEQQPWVRRAQHRKTHPARRVRDLPLE